MGLLNNFALPGLFCVRGKLDPQMIAELQHRPIFLGRILDFSPYLLSDAAVCGDPLCVLREVVVSAVADPVLLSTWDSLASRMDPTGFAGRGGRTSLVQAQPA